MTASVFHARLLCALLAAGPLVSSAEDRAVGFGWFDSVVGNCWTAVLPDGDSRHVHCYTRQFGHFIRGTSVLSSVKDGQDVVQFEGDSLFAWDESRKLIVYYIWGSDGSHRRLEAQYAGAELVFPVPSRADPGTVVYRSVWRLVDPDTLEVRRERPDGTAWRTEFKVSYSRAGIGGP
jgi:hypothetical protein